MRKKILIVEDDESILMLLTNVFLNDHNMVATATSRSEAEKALSLNNFDLVITDVKLHRSDEFGGIKLLEYIKERNPSTAVIVMTGNGSHGVRDEAYKKGALHFYEKPFDIRHLSTLAQGNLDIVARLASDSPGQSF